MNTEQLYRLFRNSTGVTTDSRNLERGQIFFALNGDNFDGNRFAAGAIERGASWAVIDNPEYSSGKTIIVDNCLAELQSLAKWHREELNVPVLAITGTNGKTTTKELVSAVLSTKFKIHRTTGNLNNHIGVPLTILSAPPDIQMMIIEMGASHRGEIETLCSIARPDYGIITNIGTAHIEGFGSYEGVLRTKSELYEYLGENDGVAFFNDRDPVLKDLAAKLVRSSVPYNCPAGNDVSVEEAASELNLDISVRYRDRSLVIETALFGRHNIDNIRAAIATGIYFDTSIDDIAGAIGNYRPSNNRSQVKLTGKNTLICDAYNANPSSMKAAIDAFSALNATPKAIILGDMLELGEKSREEHLKLISLAESVNADIILLVGKNLASLATGRRLKIFSDVNALTDYLRNNPVSGHAILVKGSRGIGLEKIYDLL